MASKSQDRSDKEEDIEATLRFLAHADPEAFRLALEAIEDLHAGGERAAAVEERLARFKAERKR